MPLPFTYWLFVIFTSLLVVFISYSTYATSRLLQHWQPDYNILLHVGENLLRIVIILLCLGLGFLSGLDAIQLGWQVNHLGGELLIGIILGLGLGVFFYHSTHWIKQIFGHRIYSTAIIDIIRPKNQGELILVLGAMLLVVLLEEILFRSLLLGGLSPLIPPMPLLIGLSLIFGLLHSPQGLWGMVGAGAAGLLFGHIFLWSQSLVIPVIAHYLTNATQILLARKQS